MACPTHRRQRICNDHLTAILRECWYLASNLRCSAEHPSWTSEPTIHAITIESIEVPHEHRREGHCRRFIEAVCADPRFEMVVVEAVQNEQLRAALHRWGWECDSTVCDFYKRKSDGARTA